MEKVKTDRAEREYCDCCGEDEDLVKHKLCKQCLMYFQQGDTWCESETGCWVTDKKGVAELLGLNMEERPGDEDIRMLAAEYSAAQDRADEQEGTGVVAGLKTEPSPELSRAMQQSERVIAAGKELPKCGKGGECICCGVCKHIVARGLCGACYSRVHNDLVRALPDGEFATANEGIAERTKLRLVDEGFYFSIGEHDFDPAKLEGATLMTRSLVLHDPPVVESTEEVLPEVAGELEQELCACCLQHWADENENICVGCLALVNAGKVSCDAQGVWTTESDVLAERLGMDVKYFDKSIEEVEEVLAVDEGEDKGDVRLVSVEFGEAYLPVGDHCLEKRTTMLPLAQLAEEEALNMIEVTFLKRDQDVVQAILDSARDEYRTPNAQVMVLLRKALAGELDRLAGGCDE